MSDAQRTNNEQEDVVTEVPKGRWVSEDFLNRVDGVCSLVYHRHSQGLDDDLKEMLRQVYSDARRLLGGMGDDDMARAE